MRQVNISSSHGQEVGSSSFERLLDRSGKQVLDLA